MYRCLKTFCILLYNQMKIHSIFQIAEAVKDYGKEDLSWSSQGMLRISPKLMMQLFKPTIENIVKVKQLECNWVPVVKYKL